MQTYTSKGTSINSRNAPAVYGMKKAIERMSKKRVLDVGGGKFDTATATAAAYGASVTIYDPYNRSEAHNREALKNSYDVAVISNVLNVIDSPAARADVVKLAANKAAVVLVTVYEGNKSGKGKQSAADCWQENRATADYIAEITAALPGWEVQRFGRLIMADKK